MVYDECPVQHLFEKKIAEVKISVAKLSLANTRPKQLQLKCPT